MKFTCVKTKREVNPFEWVMHTEIATEHIRSHGFESADEARKHAFQTMYFLFHKSAPLPGNLGVSTLKFDNEASCGSETFRMFEDDIAAIDDKFFDPEHVKKDMAEKAELRKLRARAKKEVGP